MVLIDLFENYLYQKGILDIVLQYTKTNKNNQRLTNKNQQKTTTEKGKNERIMYVIPKPLGLKLLQMGSHAGKTNQPTIPYQPTIQYPTNQPTNQSAN